MVYSCRTALFVVVSTVDIDVLSTVLARIRARLVSNDRSRRVYCRFYNASNYVPSELAESGRSCARVLTIRGIIVIALQFCQYFVQHLVRVPAAQAVYFSLSYRVSPVYDRINSGDLFSNVRMKLSYIYCTYFRTCILL